jgi:hypothetical protein
MAMNSKHARRDEETQAADLVQLDLDMVVSMGTPATRAALDAGAKPLCSG